MMDKFGANTWLQTTRRQKPEDEQLLKGYDITKCYSGILKNNESDIPIYTIHDKVEAYDGKDITVGEYYITSISLPNGLTIKGAFYGYHLINYL